MGKKRAVHGQKTIPKSYRKIYVAIIATLSLIVIVQAILLFQPTQDQTTRICTTYGGTAKLQCVEDYVGLTQDAAKEKAKQAGYSPRVAMIDGVGQGDTDEYTQKIYLVVKKGVVVDAYFMDASRQNCTTYGGKTNEQCIEDYIGLTRQEAINKARRARISPQISSVDGKEKVTEEVDGYAIYFEIERGVVARGHF